MAVDVVNNRWARKTGDFAVNLGEKDLSGLFSKKIVIEEGTAGLLMVQGRFDTRLEPGEHALEGGIGAILRNKNRKNIVLVTLGETSLEATLLRLLTRDPVPFNVRCAVTMRFTPGREAVFLSNFMSGKDYLGINELKSLVDAELREGAQDWAGSHEIQELAENLSLRGELAMTLESHLRSVLDRNGLSFGRLEVKEFTCKIWDKSVDQRVETSLQLTQEQAELEGRKRLFDVAVMSDVQDLAEETQKTATHEKRIVLWQRMRRAANQEEIDKIASEQELENFIRQIDRDKLLNEDEFERFKIELRQSGEDKERLRSRLLRVAEMEEEYDFARNETVLKTGLDRQQAQAELGLERLRLEGALETDLKRIDLELEQQRRQGNYRRAEENAEATARWQREVEEARTEAQARGIARESDTLDADMELALEENRLAQQRLHKEEQSRIDLERQASLQEQEIQREEAALQLKLTELRELHRQELETVGTYSGASLHALIAVADDGKAPMLADLARTETLKDMSPEQILAMAAAKSPELGSAIAEMAGSGSNQQATEMYERLLSEQKESASQARGSQEDMTRAMKEMFNKALETQAQVSQAFARGGSQSQSGGAAETPAQPPAEQPAAQRVVVCRRCLQESGAGTRFCPNCGGSLMAAPE
jgi:hypothetical protein